MSAPKNYVDEYQRKTRELLVKRALGDLSTEDEAEIAEQLDESWRELSPEQQQAIEDWLEVELQPAPSTDLGPVPNPIPREVESDNIADAPRRSAA